MATEIGRLFALIGVDTSEFDRKIEGIAKKAGDLGRKMAVAGAAVTGAITALVYKTAESRHELGELAQKVGLSVEFLSSFQLAAKKAGTSVEELSMGFGLASRKIVDAATKGGEVKKLFDSLDISVRDKLTGGVRNLEDALLDVADVFSKMPDGAIKTGLALEIFGRSGKNLIPILNLGRDGLKAEMEEAKRLGLVFSAEAGEAANKFIEQQVEMKAVIGAAGRAIGEVLIPPLTVFMKKVTEAVLRIREWIKAHPELVQWIGMAGLRLGVLLTLLGSALIILPKVIAGVQALGSSFSILSAGLLAAYGAYLGLMWVRDKFEKKGSKQEEALQKEVKAWDVYSEKVGGMSDFLAGAVKKGVISSAEAMKMLAQYRDDVDPTKGRWAEGYVKDWKDIATGMKGTGLREYFISLTGYTDDQAEASKKAKMSAEELEAMLAKLGKQKEWPERLKELGVLTIKMRKEGLEKCRDELKKLDKMYNTNQLTLGDYKKAVGEVKDELNELAIGIETEALPAARDLGDVIAQAPGKFDVTPFEDKTKGVADMTQDLASVITSSFSSMADAVVGWGETSGNVLTDILSSFKAFVGQMITKILELTLIEVLSAEITSIAHAIASVIKTLGFWGIPLAIVAAAATKALFSALIPKFKEGGKVSSPTLAVVGEVPEWIIPDKKLRALFAGIRARTEPSMQVFFNVSAIDEYSVRKFMRDKAAPELIQMLKGNVKGFKSETKEALG
jgi:hypothetical protein